MRYLGMPARSHTDWLEIINQSSHVQAGTDYYNQGELFDLLETQIAQLLGQPQAMFFNKGTTCQLALLKTLCEQRNNPHVALHPQSHIAFDESDAYIHLMGLQGLLIGATDQALLPKDLQTLNTTPAVLVIELPLRRAGFKLAPWSTLLALRQWCDQHRVHMHMDGARLWESACYYQRSLPEITRLFDSVYVSLYKGIGAMSGALLTGPPALLADCQVWRDRLGSNMYTTFPALITALEGLKNNLPKIPDWVKRAHQLAKLLNQLPGLQASSPQTNGFQIHLNGHSGLINKHLETLSQKHQLRLCQPFAPTLDEHTHFTEIQVGLGSEDITDTEIIDFFTQLINHKLR